MKDCWMVVGSAVSMADMMVAYSAEKSVESKAALMAAGKEGLLVDEMEGLMAACWGNLKAAC